MLARIHAATADITGLPEVPRRYQPAGRGPGSADEALVSLFEERASDYQATVRRCAEAEVAQVIADAVAARGAGRIGVPRGFPALWSALLPGPVFDDPPLDVAALDALDGVVTTCAVAIAETGTIVLDTGPGRAAGRSRWYRIITWPWCAPGRLSRPYPTRSRRWTRCGRSPGSAGPARPATSSSAGSRACTGHGPSTS
jgi:L-lactate dehydrogenase complex protein LldG